MRLDGAGDGAGICPIQERSPNRAATGSRPGSRRPAPGAGQAIRGYVDDRAKEIHTVNADPIAQNKTARIHNLLDEFTRLSDDLQDNMDQYDEQHADLRKVLKEIITKTDEWGKILAEPKPSAQYDFLRKTAIDSNQSAHETAVKMLADEEKYIAEKKKEEKEREKEEQKR